MRHEADGRLLAEGFEVLVLCVVLEPGMAFGAMSMDFSLWRFGPLI